ncbi:MAG TPA: hypothetical protein VFV15_07095 [Moraxellaceae bacterium]|nr:hypothetical protein [Moraxellaceae bacterium]
MSMHIAFVSSPELRRHSEQLIAQVESGSDASQADLMIDTVNRFTDEILTVFFVDLIDLLQLNPVLSRAIHGAVATIKATIHGVARTIIHRLDNRSLMPLADYMGGVMLTAPDTSGDPTPYIGFTVDDATRQGLQQLMQDMRAGEPRRHEKTLESLLLAITDRALEVYMLTPLGLLELGFLLRKSAEGGVAVVRGAIHMVIRRLLPDLDGPQLLAVAHHLGGLLLADGKPYREH